MLISNQTFPLIDVSDAPNDTPDEDEISYSWNNPYVGHTVSGDENTNNWGNTLYGAAMSTATAHYPQIFPGPGMNGASTGSEPSSRAQTTPEKEPLTPGASETFPIMENLLDFEMKVPHSDRDWAKIRLADFLMECSDLEIMRHLLGNLIPGAPSALDDAYLVGLDAEWWEKDPNPITELGFAELRPSKIVPIHEPHAEDSLLQIQTTHLRIMENAHLVNKFRGAGNPEDFHFGTSAFIPAQEALKVLMEVFCRFIHADGEQPRLRPVIFIGHAVECDFEKLSDKLGVDLLKFGTIVKVIDTQILAKEAGIVGPKGPNISLKHMLEYFHIQPDNLHMAGNDIAYTMVAAVLAALKNDLYTSADHIPEPIVNGRHIQDVLADIKAVNKAGPPPPWGVTVFCTRCDRLDHSRDECTEYVNCIHCCGSSSKKISYLARTHMTEKCLFPRAFNNGNL